MRSGPAGRGLTLLLDELLTALQAVGGVFILAGIALVRLDQLRADHPAAPEPAPAR